jgi:hypothetical protein
MPSGDFAGCQADSGRHKPDDILIGHRVVTFVLGRILGCLMLLQEIQIELAGLCNATCSYCTWRQRPGGKQLMRPETALRGLDDAKARGVSPPPRSAGRD